MPRAKKEQYLTEREGREIINVAVKKFGSTRQLGLRLDCSMAHIYRLKNGDNLMRETWKEKILDLLD